MKVNIIVEVLSDEGRKVSVGDIVEIKTAQGIFKGKVKSLKSKLIGISCDNGHSYGILYKDILELK